MDGARSAGRPARACALGLDVGTTAVRGALYAEDDGAALAGAEEPLTVHGRGGARELDFEEAWRATEAVLDRLGGVVGGRPLRVGHLGVAATASTVAPFDVDLRPTTRGLLWADHRATAEAAEIRATRHPVLARSLGHVSPEWGLPKLMHLWRAAAGPAAPRGGRRRRSVRHVLELVDWLDWKLTGRLIANAGIREWGWCVDDAARWPPDLVARLGIGPALALVPPESAPTGNPLGPIRGEVAARHRLLDGASVTMGGMDSYIAALGQGVVRPGRLAASFGSSSSLLAGAASGDGRGHLYGPFRRILPGHGDGYWHGGQSTAGLAVEWAARLLGRSMADLEAAAAAVPPGSDGVVFRETLLDRRTPRPEGGLRGVWDGLALAHGPGHLFRSVLEAVAFGARLAMLPLGPDEVVLTAGLARSPLFVGILAQVLGRPVGLLRHGSAATFGAAFAHDPERIPDLNPVQAWVAPEPPAASLEEAFRRYRALHDLPRSVGAIATAGAAA